MKFFLVLSFWVSTILSVFDLTMYMHFLKDFHVFDVLAPRHLEHCNFVRTFISRAVVFIHIRSFMFTNRPISKVEKMHMRSEIEVR